MQKRFIYRLLTAIVFISIHQIAFGQAPVSQKERPNELLLIDELLENNLHMAAQSLIQDIKKQNISDTKRAQLDYYESLIS